MSDFIVSDQRSEPWFLLQYAVFKVPSSLLPDFWKPMKCIKDFIVCQPLFRLTFDRVFCQMETERFELLTPCLQGRCSPNWATPPYLIGGHLLSHTVSSIVPSAVWVLTIVFGMGTGVTPRRIATKNFCYLPSCNMMLCYNYSESASLLPHRANPHITIFLSQHPCKHACSLLIQKPLLHSVFDN